MIVIFLLCLWLPCCAAYIVPYARCFGVTLWLVAIVGHLAICANFIYYRIKFFHHDHIVPSGFVPPVGIVVACVTSVDMGFPLLARILFYVGFSLYSVLLPIILYRLFFGTRLTDEQLPTFAIMGHLLIYVCRFINDVS